MELVMDILDTAAFNHHQDELSWSLTLSLISHPARASVLPILYRTLFLDVKKLKGTPCIGWDGRSHAHRQLAFLSWLIHDSKAPPRRHIKHFIFRHDGDFSATDLRWGDAVNNARFSGLSSSSEGDESEDNSPVCLWKIEHLTVRFQLDARQLHMAGICVAQAHHVKLASPVDGDAANTDLLSRFMSMAVPFHGSRNRGISFYRTWIWQSGDHSQQDLRILSGLVQTELDPSNMRGWPAAAAADVQPNIFIVFDLAEGDGFPWSPTSLFEDVMETLLEYPNAAVVFACKPTFRVGGHTMEDLVTNAAPNLISLESLERIYFSKQTWDRDVEIKDPFVAFTRMVTRGHNPWDHGCKLL